MPMYEDCIIFLLAKAFQKAHGTAKSRWKQYGLTPEQQLVLATVVEMEGSSAGEIGQALRLDSATLSGILERMADKGFIEKRQDENDRRVVRIYPNPQMRDKLPKMLEARDEVNEEVLAPLTHEERVLFKRMLREIS